MEEHQKTYLRMDCLREAVKASAGPGVDRSDLNESIIVLAKKFETFVFGK